MKKSVKFEKPHQLFQMQQEKITLALMTFCTIFYTFTSL